MDKSDLYFEEMAWDRYLTDSDCKKCGADSCKKLVEQLHSGNVNVSELQSLPEGKAKALESAIKGRQMLPEVPKLTFPRPVDPDLVELNDPKDGDPIIVTGNNQYTQEVILTVLSTMTNSFFVLFTDTRGDTLDMAVVFESFTVNAINESFENTGLKKRIGKSPIVIPGKAGELSQAIQERLNLDVEIGPVCAAEIPLYFNARQG